MRKIYVSGKIGNLPRSVWEMKFLRIKNLLANKYDEVVTPSEICKKVEKEFGVVDYATYLAADIVTISECSHIFMMKDWRKSPGAKVERAYAKACGIKVVYERWENLKTKWECIFKKN